MVIVPVESHISLLGAENPEGQLPDLENQIADNLMKRAKEVLTERGFEILKFDEDNEELSRERSAAIKRYYPRGYGNLGRLKGVGYAISQSSSENLTGEADGSLTRIAEISNADSVLLIFFEGSDRTAGRAVKDSIGTAINALFGVRHPNISQTGYVVYVVMSDRTSGQHLWADKIRSGRLRDGNEDDVFNSFPIPVPM
ncbi:hypothetical protein NBRC116493_22110 [Aurantivibrio infirmus]